MISLRKFTLGAIVAVALLSITGCTPTEEQDSVTALQAALSSLMQNRSLVEQFGRDIKSSVDPTDPSYSQLMESYESARDSYNHFLDTVELEVAAHHSNAELAPSAKDAQNATTSFLASATRALQPNSDLRGIAFRRAIVIPENLTTALRCLPKRDRRELISRFGDQVRVRSWGQL
jgi:hypothetical protein